MKIGICGPVAKAAEAKAAGADFLEENIQGFLMPEKPAEQFAEKLAAASAAPLDLVAANCFLPGALKCVGPEVDTPRLLRYAQSTFTRAGAAGIEAIVFGSGGARRVPDGFPQEKAFEQLVDLVKKMAPFAQENGVVLVVEPLNRGECNWINSLADAARIVEAVGHPSVWLLADIYHMLREDEPAAELERFGRLLRHVHIAEKAERTAPGTKGDDFGAYLRALKSAGYAGPLSVECRWGEFESEAPRAVEFLRARTAEAGL